jgi:hypothetical protein
MPHFLNLWRSTDDIRTFCLFNVWVSPDFFGITLFNFGLEWALSYEGRRLLGRA